MSNIGKNIRTMRQLRGMSQQELANRLGYSSKATIARIESGDRTFPPDRLNDFAVTLGTTIEQLVYGKDKEELEQIISGKDLLKNICKDSPKALELLDSMKITDTGDITVNRCDTVSAAVIGHAIRGLIAALQSAEIDSTGKAKAVIKVNDLLPLTEGK